jgi:hypothetical protein
MDAINWLMTLTSKHQKSFREKIREQRHPRSRDLEQPDEFDEIKFHHESVSDMGQIPMQLSELSPIALLVLSYFLKATIGGDDHVLGKEVIDKLINDPVNTFTYLNAIDELKQKSWFNIELDRSNPLKVKPYIYLQTRLDIGDAFTTIEESFTGEQTSYATNEDYLDAMFNYLNDFTERNRRSRKNDSETDNSLEFKPDRPFQRIMQRVDNSTVPLPATKIMKEQKLSGWQYLFLMGLLGQAEKVLFFDFADIDEVIRLFVTGYSKRMKMKQHLVGDKSSLIINRLVEGREGDWGKEYKITASTTRLLLGKRSTGKSMEEMKKYVDKHTIFEFDRPKVKPDGLLLPDNIMETIQTILHAEKPEGKKARKALRKILPATVGAPTGSTILIYAGPGTGKTLSAQYIASELKVPLLKIDCSQVLGMFVGQSEKNVKRIFTDYDEICSSFHCTPVLLLNEADQLLGERHGAKDAVDRMNNNMQNLFLEGLEKFSGILIATTNRKDLLDSAFSRRFTYKLELPPPDISLRRKLWESHIPTKMISDTIDYDLLSTLPLTGGEIRLVLEQAVRSAAFKGLKTLNNSLLLEIARTEVVASGHDTQSKIGFQMQ